MPAPTPDWVSFDASKTQGLDLLLGLRAPVQATGNELTNGLTSVTPKLRYSLTKHLSDRWDALFQEQGSGRYLQAAGSILWSRDWDGTSPPVPLRRPITTATSTSRWRPWPIRKFSRAWHVYAMHAGSRGVHLAFADAGHCARWYDAPEPRYVLTFVGTLELASILCHSR